MRKIWLDSTEEERAEIEREEYEELSAFMETCKKMFAKTGSWTWFFDQTPPNRHYSTVFHGEMGEPKHTYWFELWIEDYNFRLVPDCIPMLRIHVVTKSRGQKLAVQWKEYLYDKTDRGLVTTARFMLSGRMMEEAKTEGKKCVRACERLIEIIKETGVEPIRR